MSYAEDRYFGSASFGESSDGEWRIVWYHPETEKLKTQVGNWVENERNGWVLIATL